MEDPGSGNVITNTKDYGQQHCLVQNTNGIMNYGEVQGSKLALFQSKHLQVDVIVLIETNRNWNNTTVRCKWENWSKAHGSIQQW